MTINSASAILTVHRQGCVLVPTARSLYASKERANEHGYFIELVAVLDRCDERTRRTVHELGLFNTIVETELGDPGLARQAGIQKATFDHLFFHDADDLYSLDWYTAFLAFSNTARYDASAIYHGEYTVGFGTDFYFRLQASSDDPGFDPIALVAQWYFATNLFVTKSICERHPIPSHDAASGLGHDDWSWACDTLAAGVRRLVVPGTASFYREKPPNVGVGKVPGIIHRKSPLFDPESVKEGTSNRLALNHGASAFPFGANLLVSNSRWIPRFPEWLLEEAGTQALFEPEISDLRDPVRAPRIVVAHPLVANVALAYRFCCGFLDNRPKIILTCSEATIPGIDHILDQLIGEISSAQDIQVIALVEGCDFNWSSDFFHQRFSVALLDIVKLKADYSISDWHMGRFLMRFFLQFQVVDIIDFGSDVFRRISSEFYRSIVSTGARLSFVYPQLSYDPLAPTKLNIFDALRLFASYSGTPPRVFSFSSDFGAHVADYGFACEVISRQSSRALRTALIRRFAEDPRIRIDAFAESLLGEIISRTPASDTIEYEAAQKKLVPAVAFCALPGIAGVIVGGTGAYSPGVLEEAGRFFSDDDAAEIYLPQALLWSDQGKRSFAWLVETEVEAQLEALVDLMIVEKCVIPLFAIFKRGGAVGRLFERLRCEDYSTNSVRLVEDLREANVAIRLLPNAACVAVARVPLPQQAYRLA